jgi:hypothetical protein
MLQVHVRMVRHEPTNGGIARRVGGAKAGSLERIEGCVRKKGCCDAVVGIL